MSNVMGNIIDSCLDKYSYGTCVGDDCFECTVIDDDDFALLRDRILSKIREELSRLDYGYANSREVSCMPSGHYVRRVDVLEMFKVVDSE